jgi:hypothetical protein
MGGCAPGVVRGVSHVTPMNMVQAAMSLVVRNDASAVRADDSLSYVPDRFGQTEGAQRHFVEGRRKGPLN